MAWNVWATLHEKLGTASNLLHQVLFALFTLGLPPLAIFGVMTAPTWHHNAAPASQILSMCSTGTGNMSRQKESKEQTLCKYAAQVPSIQYLTRGRLASKRSASECIKGITQKNETLVRLVDKILHQTQRTVLYPCVFC